MSTRDPRRGEIGASVAADVGKQERVPCFRDDDCAMYACIRCGGTGWVKPEIAEALRVRTE